MVSCSSLWSTLGTLDTKCVISVKWIPCLLVYRLSCIPTHCLPLPALSRKKLFSPQGLQLLPPHPDHLLYQTSSSVFNCNLFADAIPLAWKWLPFVSKKRPSSSPSSDFYLFFLSQMCLKKAVYLVPLWSVSLHPHCFSHIFLPSMSVV